MPTIRVEFQGLNAQGVSAARMAGNLGLLTDAEVAAADTNAGIQAAIRAAAITHGENIQAEERLARAIQTWGDIGVATDAAINPLTTVAGLVALGLAVDERLDANYTSWSPKE